ncbi:hypothetical protein [Acetobacterium tundrae]|uniref:Flagellar hook-length control protein-like C-terminal domain-containing protein n=1 Tax=Acetobacterium tundrae TaxID=132932 RepID=A0ABR6WKN6_9FIRM|nr:hypothetical protein [Acetobacterium tundrae]MBC3797049.1 hypothetical protein [Acetobacterium tundrae]
MDSIKITSTVQSPKTNDITSKPIIPGDAIFNLNNTDISIKTPETSDNLQQESFRDTLFQNLQKEILKPLLNSTSAEADSLRKFILIAQLFDGSIDAIPKEMLDGIFINSQDLLSALLTQDKTETIFKGSFFDSLRSLAKLEGYPQLKEAIVGILRHYDAYVNRNQTLKGIFIEISHLLTTLPAKEKALLAQELTKLESALTGNKAPEQSDQKLVDLKTILGGKNQTSPELQKLIDLKAAQSGKNLTNQLERIETALDGKSQDFQAIQKLLKNEVIPALRQILNSQSFSDKTYQSISTIIDHIVRYDKGDPEQLEASVLKFAQALKPLSNLTDTEIVDMKKQLFFHAKEAEILSDRINSTTQDPQDRDKVELAHLIEKALDDSNSTKIINSAQNLLETIIRNESPIFSLMHFLIPLRFLDANTYGEFFVDKDPAEKDGSQTNSETATDIFFTIQTDKYGNFEVELSARDKSINLNINCPPTLVDTINSSKDKLKSIVEEQGYKLASCGIAEYVESQSILQRYPKLAFRKVGIDVTV